MKIYDDISRLVGHTPLIRISRYRQAAQCPAQILVKAEGFNAAGSVKDRVGLRLIEQAETDGLLRPGATVIEPTSGNTGIGLAMACALKGYRLILTMPESMSVERRKLLAALGADIILTPAKDGMTGAIEKARQLSRDIPDSVIPGQFTNPANVRTHYESTGPEIWTDTGGKIDLFIAGVGTGGTITGAGAYLKEQNPALQIVAVEPAGSAVLSGGKAGPHGLMGIGAGFVPEILNIEIINEVITVDEPAAYRAARLLARTEALLTGISSGAALHAATLLAQRPENAEKTLVVLLPDTGERYLSTPLFE